MGTEGLTGEHGEINRHFS